METVKLALHAMATRFEIVLQGENPFSLRAAGEAALEEIGRLEGRLSLYRPGSDIARVNTGAARHPIPVAADVFALLQQAQELNAETGGAFDITVGPLVRCWGFMGGTGRLPTPAELAAARAQVGMRLVELNPEKFTVRFACEGVMLDLGAIGKGYAIDQAVETLREAGVTRALVHGGTSTVYGLGAPFDAEAWTVAIDHPRGEGSLGPFATVGLKDEALSVSAVWGKSFQAGDRTYGHVLDPRTGEPVRGALLAAVALPSATETDALSTALLTCGAAGHEAINGLRPGMRTLVAEDAPGECRVEAKGISSEGPETRRPEIRSSKIEIRTKSKN